MGLVYKETSAMNDSIIQPIHVLVIEDGGVTRTYTGKSELDMFMDASGRFQALYRIEKEAADVPAYLEAARAYIADLAAVSNGALSAAYYVLNAPVTVFGGGE
jgi:hypothetical protein